MTSKPAQRVMLELRPCFDGFAGIPQETRVIFSGLHTLPGIDPVGLILHPARRLARTTSRFDQSRAAALDRVGRLIISSEDDDPATPLDAFRMKTARARETISLLAATASRLPIRPTALDASQFVDYFWERLFEKGLEPHEIPMVKSAEYQAIRPSWLSLHNIGTTGVYPMMDTRGIDTFVAQTPWPTNVHPSTNLVIRYHDAIPIFHPHQIKYPAMHQAHHYKALKMNAKVATFVCTSEAARADLLDIVPEVENRSTVVNTGVSPQFYADPQSDEHVIEIANRRMSKRPSASNPLTSPFRYALVVSTIEPRKNHVRLIDAWERINRLDPDLKLVVVGSPGWGRGAALKRLRKPISDRRAFHLTNLTTEELRHIYSNAEVVVCPSVAEGFDLSGAEAMMCGAPVVASDIPVHREVYEDGARYFNPYIIDDMAQSLYEITSGPSALGIQEELRAAGISQSARYTQQVMHDAWGGFFDDLAAGKFARSHGR